MVNIYFNAGSFDKVTRSAKTNFVSQLSLIGGTFGLFTGFSILSGIEIIYFFIKVHFLLYVGRVALSFNNFDICLCQFSECLVIQMFCCKMIDCKDFMILATKLGVENNLFSGGDHCDGQNDNGEEREEATSIC